MEDLTNDVAALSIEKKNLGQFYTTNADKILKNMIIPESITSITSIIEPFAGNMDLANWAKAATNIEPECYDIAPQNEQTIKRDTLLNPIQYKETDYVITNPPYLARNKSSDKTLYDMYDVNDLYKCFIKTLIASSPCGGIMIIPLNFLCSIRRADCELRQEFLSKFKITASNIFEEQVFHDTTYAVVAIQFEKHPTPTHTIPCTIYPINKSLTLSLTNWMINGEIYDLPQSNYIFGRATNHTSHPFPISFTNIVMKCIDDTTKICLFKSNDIKYIDNTAKQSARSYALLTCTPHLTENQQSILISSFNTFIAQKRKHHSLFLSNYRDGASARKRISFSLGFQICSYLMRDTDSSS